MKFNLVSGISTTSYGLVGLNILKGLDRLGYKVSLFPIGGMEAPQEDHELIRRSIDNCKFYNSNAPSLRIWHQFDQSLHAGRERNGYTIFELDKFSENEIHHLQQLDKLMVCSEWAKTICLTNGVSGTQVNVHTNQTEKFGPSIHVVPLGVDRGIFHENASPLGDLKLGDATVFGVIGKWELRKGHDFIWEVFDEAFSEEDNVYLLMHCHSRHLNEKQNREWYDLYMNSKMGQAGKVYVSENRVDSQGDVAALMACADCGVFPALAEGWNLEALEMLSMGKSLIITNYSGHTEFCTPENSYLIEPDGLTEAWDSIWFHGNGQWLDFTESMKNTLVEHLRKVHDLKQSGKLRRNDAGIETAKKFSWDNTVAKLLESY